MDPRFDAFLFESLLYSINTAIHTLVQYQLDDDAWTDFTPCCVREETDLLQKVILAVMDANQTLPRRCIYTAVIFYYYVCIVMEYYAIELMDTKFLQSFVKFADLVPIQQLVRDMTLSDQSWATQVRRAINHL